MLLDSFELYLRKLYVFTNFSVASENANTYLNQFLPSHEDSLSFSFLVVFFLFYF